MSVESKPTGTYTIDTNVAVIDDALRTHSRYFVVVGPKGCGKTTLVKSLTRGQASLLTLSDPAMPKEAVINTLIGTFVRHIVIDDTKWDARDIHEIWQVLERIMRSRSVIVWHVVTYIYNARPAIADAHLVFRQNDEATVAGVHAGMKLRETDLTEEALAALIRAVPGEYSALVVTPRQTHMSIVRSEV